jgi:hypothetical protein
MTLPVRLTFSQGFRRWSLMVVKTNAKAIKPHLE